MVAAGAHLIILVAPAPRGGVGHGRRQRRVVGLLQSRVVPAGQPDPQPLPCGQAACPEPEPRKLPRR